MSLALGSRDHAILERLVEHFSAFLCGEEKISNQFLMHQISNTLH